MSHEKLELAAPKKGFFGNIVHAAFAGVPCGSNSDACGLTRYWAKNIDTFKPMV